MFHIAKVTEVELLDWSGQGRFFIVTSGEYESKLHESNTTLLMGVDRFDCSQFGLVWIRTEEAGAYRGVQGFNLIGLHYDEPRTISNPSAVTERKRG